MLPTRVSPVNVPDMKKEVALRASTSGQSYRVFGSDSMTYEPWQGTMVLEQLKVSGRVQLSVCSRRKVVSKSSASMCGLSILKHYHWAFFCLKS